MKYYIISGEASGDLHGSHLVRALNQQDQEADFRGWGGDLMQASGVVLSKHYKELAFMGVWQVLKHLPSILNNFKVCKSDILNYAPDVLILIDYSGFNLRIAQWAKQQGLRVFYYISPQIWATREKRVHKIKRYVDRMFVILPFEKAFYQKHQYEVDFVGHPLLDVVQEQVISTDFRTTAQLSNAPIIALLPGSRKQEIRSMLRVMLSLAPEFKAYQFVIAGAPSIPTEFYEEFLQEMPNVKLLHNNTYNLLRIAEAALVTSGTATLETALFKVPQVVCYRASALLYHIVKRIIKVRYISIVNLIMDRKIVEELIQNDLNKAQLQAALNAILTASRRQELQADYNELEKKLGKAGAAQRTAQLMLEALRN